MASQNLPGTPGSWHRVIEFHLDARHSFRRLSKSSDRVLCIFGFHKHWRLENLLRHFAG
jgi:hypothetical protein